MLLQKGSLQQEEGESAFGCGMQLFRQNEGHLYSE